MGSPTADVQFTIAAQSAAAQMTMFSNHIKRSLKEIREEAKRVNKPEGNQGANNNIFASWSGDITRATAALGGFVGVVGVAKSAVALVKAELQSVLDRAEAARGRQVPFQAELLGMVKSIPAGEDQEAVGAKLVEMLKNSSVADKAMLTRMAKGAASAVSGMPYLERVQAAINVAENNPDLAARDPAALDALGQQAVLGVHTFGASGATAEAQQQLFFKGLTSARVSDPRLYAENVMGQVPKLNTDFGLNQFQGLALMNALTTGAQDPTGELAPTAAYSVLTGVMKARQRFGADIPQDFDKALEYIQDPSNPKSKEIRDFVLGAFSEEFKMTDEERTMLSEAQLNKKLAANLPGSRMKTIYSAMGLFQAKGQAEEPMGMKNLLKTAYDELGVSRMPDGTINEAESYALISRDWKKQQDRLARNPAFANFQLDRSLQNATESINVSAGKADSAVMFKEADEMFRQAGASSLQRFLWRSGDYMFNSNENDDVRDRLKSRAMQMIEQNAYHDPRYYNLPGGGQQITASVNKTNLPEILKDNMIDAAEQKKYGFKESETKLINALFELIKKLDGAFSRPLAVEVKNQPPAQPRQPAAAALGGGPRYVE